LLNISGELVDHLGGVVLHQRCVRKRQIVRVLGES